VTYSYLAACSWEDVSSVGRGMKLMLACRLFIKKLLDCGFSKFKPTKFSRVATYLSVARTYVPQIATLE
jgi:hypothetical protein